MKPFALAQTVAQAVWRFSQQQGVLLRKKTASVLWVIGAIGRSVCYWVGYALNASQMRRSWNLMQVPASASGSKGRENRIPHFQCVCAASEWCIASREREKKGHSASDDQTNESSRMWIARATTEEKNDRLKQDTNILSFCFLACDPLAMARMMLIQCCDHCQKQNWKNQELSLLKTASLETGYQDRYRVARVVLHTFGPKKSSPFISFVALQIPLPLHANKTSTARMQNDWGGRFRGPFQQQHQKKPFIVWPKPSSEN